MAQSIKPGPTASTTIPYLYRFPLLYLEPLFALSGAMLVLTNPQKYLASMSRNSISTFDTSTQFIYTELAGGWLHLVFTEAVIFRLVDDVRVWRLICMSILLSDAAYCHSCAQAVGGWKAWLVVSEWTVEDWTVAVTTWPFLLARLAIVFGVGFRSEMGREAKRG